MAPLVKWESVLSQGLNPMFSPSGHAVVVHPVLRLPILQALEISFADDRAPILIENASLIHPIGWASDTELVYRTSGPPLGVEAKSALHVFSTEDQQSRFLTTVEDTVDATWMGVDGHLCVLTELEGRSGLFDLDVRTGVFQRMTGFDEAFDRLQVYPLFRHSWSAQCQEAAVVAWPHDYLEEGVEPTRMNSHWTPILDDPSIQNCISRKDGSRITQRELTREAKRKKPFRLFLLDTAGECREVPGTYKAHHPLWSPDGSVIAFQRYEERGEGIWLLRRSDLSLCRAGTLSLSNPVLHPSGVLFYQTADETIRPDKEHERKRAMSAKWQQLQMSAGDIPFVEQG